MPMTINIGAMLEPGLKSEATMVYTPAYEGIRKELGDIMWLEMTSDKLQEVYAYMETPPYFTWWPAGTNIPEGTFSSQRFTIINRDFGRRVNLPRNVDDDVTGTAYTMARMIAQTYSLLPTECFQQILQESSYNGTTAPLPVLPKWADGSDMYETSTRYGSSSGNVVSVTSTSTVQGVITDINSVTRRFQEFQNTQSRPYFDPSETKTMKVIHGPAVTMVMNQAKYQTRTPWEVTSGSNSTGQTPTNLLQEGGWNIQYVPIQYITNSRYYCFLTGLANAKRSLWRQVRKGYTEWQGNFITSDTARDSGVTYVQGDCREGYGAALAIGTIRVS